MSGDLRVITAHVCELAAKQREASAEITSATEVVEGVDTAVRWSHGVIAWSTAAAVESAQSARRGAGTGMAMVSLGLGDRLTDAAARYDQIDSAIGGKLEREMAPRS